MGGMRGLGNVGVWEGGCVAKQESRVSKGSPHSEFRRG